VLNEEIREECCGQVANRHPSGQLDFHRSKGVMRDLNADQALELEGLRSENARLIALLKSHGIEWRLPPQPIAVGGQEPEQSKLSTAEKVALFRRLFRGRTDVYPIRWESKSTGKSGYAPACANEWRAGVCEKPRIKCGDCSNRLLIPLSDAVIYDHLAGEHMSSASNGTSVA
jgi:hypothetical protein